MKKRKALVVSSPSEKHKGRRRNQQQQQHDDDDDNDEDPPEEAVYQSDYDGKSSTTETLWNQLQTELSSPLAHRDMNAIQEYEETTKGKHGGDELGYLFLY